VAGTFQWRGVALPAELSRLALGPDGERVNSADELLRAAIGIFNTKR